MELAKDIWTKKDILEFQNYIKGLGNPAKVEWATGILQTKLPVLCLNTPTIKLLIKGISEGNYLSFLDHMIWEYYENTAVNGYLICMIKDFDLMKKYLDIYSRKMDCWATCDLLSFNIKGREDKFYNLSKEYLNSNLPFVRRLGLYLLFYYITDDKHINDIFNTLDKFVLEDDYYVNMMGAWLLSECFLKQRNKTIKYLEKNKTNKFIINKGIQKCRDSRRTSKEDKDMLLIFKVK